MLPHQVTAVLLDVNQLQMLSAGTFIYLKQKYYIITIVLSSLLYVFHINLYIFVLPDILITTVVCHGKNYDLK